jgi:alanyl-tRNA synthetase
VLLNNLTEIVKVSKSEELPGRINSMLERMKVIEKELSALHSAKALQAADSLLTSKTLIGSLEVISAEIASGVSVDDLRQIATSLRAKLKSGVVVLISKGEERATLVVAVSDEATSMGIKAGALVKVGSAVLGGGGGGRDDFAQGGGANMSAISSALTEITQLITSTVK